MAAVLPPFSGGGIHIGIMFRNVCVGIEAVDHIEMLCQSGRHDGQIRRAAAADDQYIDFVFVFFDILRGICLCAVCCQLQSCRIPSGEYAEQFHVGILPDGQLHTLAQIAVTVNTNSHICILFCKNELAFYMEYYTILVGICKVLFADEKKKVQPAGAVLFV